MHPLLRALQRLLQRLAGGAAAAAKASTGTPVQSALLVVNFVALSYGWWEGDG